MKVWTTRVAVVSITGEAPLTVEFPAAGDGKEAAEWDYGDGTRERALAGRHAYAAPGTYDVRATLADGRTLVRTVTVNARQTAALQIVPPAPEPAHETPFPPSPEPPPREGPPALVFVGFGAALIFSGAALALHLRTRDARDEFDGTKLSHACVMRRVSELGVPLVQVGIRSHSAEEAPLIEAGRVPRGGSLHTHFMHEGWSADLVEGIVERLGNEVYVTFDVDALDPSILPATGTPEPGGLTWYQSLDLLREVFSRRTVIGFDVVELAPAPGQHASDFLAAKLVYRMAGYLARARGWL